MDVDHILDTMNRHSVECLLIGGMNFLLRHAPVLTYDVDLWIADTPANRRRCEAALAALQAEWGATEDDWGPVAARPAGWLDCQALYCLTSPAGAVDIFRAVKGLDDWAAAYARAVSGVTAGGIAYRGLSDADMLRSQEALPAAEQKPERLLRLRQALQEGRHG